LHQQYAYSISTNSVKWKCILDVWAWAEGPI
jgi:hypothetical protein